MPRTARLAFENAFYHVYNRGANKQAIFFDERDYQHFLTKLQALKTEKHFDHELYAYVLLPNHFHLLIQTKKVPIAQIMRSLTTSYSVHVNRKYERTGPVFENRFKSKLCDRDVYFLGVSRYVFLNPVVAGLAKKPEDYPWSGYLEAIGKTAHFLLTPDVQRLVGASDKERAAYMRFVRDGLPQYDRLEKEYSFEKEIGGAPLFQSLTQKKYSRRRTKTVSFLER